MRHPSLGGITMRSIPDTGVPIIDAHLDHCRARRQRPATVYARRGALLRLTRWLRGHGWADPVTAADGRPATGGLLGELAAALAAWQQSLTSTDLTVAGEVAHARRFYAWTVDTEILTRSPARRLFSPRVPRRVPRPIGEAALAAALRGARPRERVWLVLAAYQGLRAGEIAGLHRADVLDDADPPMLIVAGKGGHIRIIPLGAGVLAELRAHGLPARGPLFPRRDGLPGPISPARLSQLANEHLRCSGVAETLHQLRHRAGTRWYAATHDLRVVQHLLGHASPTTTAGYAAWSHTAAVGAVAAVDADLGGGTRP